MAAIEKFVTFVWPLFISAGLEDEPGAAPAVKRPGGLTDAAAAEKFGEIIWL